MIYDGRKDSSVEITDAAAAVDIVFCRCAPLWRRRRLVVDRAARGSIISMNVLLDFASSRSAIFEAMEIETRMLGPEELG